MDYQGNSNKGKESKPKPPKKDLEKVVTGEVKVKSPTISSRFKNIFFGGDIDSTASYVVSEVLLPALRNLVSEAVSRGVDRLVYGDSARPRRPSNYSPRVQYNNPLSSRTRDPRYQMDPRQAERQSRDRKPFEDVIVASKADADLVVERLVDIVDMYEVASVADLYELLGLPSSHVDNKWGWTQLSSIDVRNVREGWKITFPPLEEIT